jgi:hypothetical protein
MGTELPMVKAAISCMSKLLHIRFGPDTMYMWGNNFGTIHTPRVRAASSTFLVGIFKDVSVN